jgi:transcriptional regulator with XRE-family HTH domain
MNWQEELGQQIRDARKRARMSQKELAAHLSVSRVTLSNYENGKSPATVNVIADITRVLDAEFEIGGCKIAKGDFKRTQDGPSPEQLCFAYDTEHRYKNAILTIRPTRKSIIINAVVARTR